MIVVYSIVATTLSFGTVIGGSFDSRIVRINRECVLLHPCADLQSKLVYNY